MPSTFNRFASFVLFATAAAAPLPFGSTDGHAVSVWCVTLGAAALAASPRMLRRPHWVLLTAFAMFIACVGLVLFGQIAQSPWSGLSPHPVWRSAADVLGTTLEPSVSVALNQPLFGLGQPLVAALAMAVSFVVCADRERAHRLLEVVVWSGAAYAAFGMASFLLDPAKLLWRDKVAHTTSLTAPFLNRNTAATYFGCCTAVCALLVLRYVSTHEQDGDRWAFLRTLTAIRLIRLAVPLLACFAALILTSSRAGVVLSLLALVLAFAAYSWRQLPMRGGLLITLLVGGLVMIAMLQILAAGVSGRFDQYGLIDPARLDTYRASLRMMADRPWAGTGLGTFLWSFPPYRLDGATMWGVWNRAHNTLLEIGVELGVPLMLLVLAGWGTILAILVNGVRLRRRDRVVPAAGLTVAVLAAAHSLVDFSLQITGFAIVALAIVGAGLAQSFPTREFK